MNNKSYLIAIALVCLAIFFPHLDVVEVNIMEARNFITAREMLDYGNWFHTTMNLEPRYEKPPLPTWMTALSGAIFGMDNLIALRLPAVFTVVLLLFSFYFLGIQTLRDKKQAFLGTLILSTSFYIIFSGRNGQWDIFTHAFMLFAIYQLFMAFESDERSWKHWSLAGVFMGLSFMSKGPVSFYALFLPFLIAYGFVFKFKGFKHKVPSLLASLLIFVIVGLTWGIYIYLTDTSAAEVATNKEAVRWTNYEVKPFYHYWSFFTQSGIWTFFSFIALLYPFMIKRVEDKKLYRFSLIWTLAAVVLLSLIPEKKERYLLPVLIPLAMNTSFYIKYLISKTKDLKKSDIYIANFGFGLIGLIGLIIPIGIYLFFDGQITGYWVAYFFTSASLFSIGVLLFIWLKKRAYEKCFYGIILFACSIVLFGFPIAELTYDNNNYHSLNEFREMDGMQDLEIYSTALLIPRPELIYDLGEPMKRVNKPEQLPQSKTFALFVYDTIPQIIQEQYKAEFKVKFDINNVKEGKRGHKEKKTMKLYVLEKKE